jgi:hypothetical protein
VGFKEQLMSATYSTGVIRNGRVELQLPLNWPEGTEVIVTPNAIDAIAELEKAERARIAAMTPSDEDLDLLAIDPPREWLEEEEWS